MFKLNQNLSPNFKAMLKDFKKHDFTEWVTVIE